MAVASVNLGVTLTELGRTDEAVQLCRQTGNRRGEAGALAALGQAYRERSQRQRAQRCWQDAVHIYTELGHRRAAELTADLNDLRVRSAPPVG